MKNNLPDNEKAVWVLKVHGPLPLQALATELGVTVEGARFQLLKLCTEGLVEATAVAKGRGRPQQIWRLTQRGHARFPDSHAELTVRLIGKMREVLGDDAVNAVIEANAKDLRAKYLKELEGVDNLEGRVKGLSAIRDREGYMAGYIKDEEGFLLVENHCPICAAATTCQGLCSAELNTFRAVFGKKASVKRVDHLLAGARRCAYRISGK